MRNLYNYWIFYFLCFALIPCVSKAQKLLQSRQKSYYTYIYKLSDKEAKSMHDTWRVDSTYFHTMVDQYSTDSIYKRKLPQGHYLKTYTHKEKQIVEITTIQQFDVFILNNNTDLCLQLYDLNGYVITDAAVYLGSTKIDYNPSTKSFIKRKTNKQGLLKITHHNFTAYYNLKKQYNYNTLKRGFNKAVYSTPMKYVWLPVNYIISLPIDAAKSIKQGWAQGSIYSTKRKAKQFWHKIKRVFNNDNSEEENYNDASNYKGYLVFNKPKYKPNDTVKFKSFLITKKGKPIDKKIRVDLWSRDQRKTLTYLDPYRKGGYEYQFVLHDSLKLKLNTQYYIYLTLKGNTDIQHAYFSYEDYELKSNKLSIRIDTTHHYNNSRLNIYLKGQNENDLNLQDAKVELLLVTKNISAYHDSIIFVPDTLTKVSKRLDPEGETLVQIDGSNFPKVNFDYEVQVTMWNSENEVTKGQKTIKYYHELQEGELRIEQDTTVFSYLKNGKQEEAEASIFAYDNFATETLIYNGKLPYKAKLQPYYSAYKIAIGDVAYKKNIKDMPSMLQCFSDRTADSIFISIDNPRNIFFSYNIYKTNTNIAEGYSNTLNFKEKTNSLENYYISLRYLWAGNIIENTYNIPILQNKLNIKVNQPTLVYPGQETMIDVLVTDCNGKPVNNVDITAFGLTKKFNYTTPDVPSLEKIKKGKSIINNFSFKEKHTVLELPLSYSPWQSLSRLDTIEYYKFLYPQNTIYKHEYTTPDSITQFAPYVLSKGQIQTIHVIYVDNKPVYFSWSNNDRPYSFKIDSGLHTITLRTSSNEYTLRDIHFNHTKKLILSIDDISSREIVRNILPSKLQPFETYNLYRYIFPYLKNSGYLEQGNDIIYLNTEKKLENYKLFAGPISGGYTFYQFDKDIKTQFIHEPYFEYEFQPNLLKMRGTSTDLYPSYLNNDTRFAKTSFTDEVYTKEKYFNAWRRKIEEVRSTTLIHFDEATYSKSHGKLQINLKSDTLPLNILLLRYDNDDFIRIYPGRTQVFNELSKGKYKLIFFYKEARYFSIDSVAIESNGTNYYKLNKPHVLTQDAFSKHLHERISRSVIRVEDYINEKALREFYNEYQKIYKYDGSGEYIGGKVIDELTNEPLIGVTVNIAGTNYGTVTDIDGYFSIKVPSKESTLTFSLIGYADAEIVSQSNFSLVKLNNTHDVLDEIVVVGYGTQKKRDLTAAASTITPSRNVYYAYSDLSNNLQGKTSGISITQKGNKTEINVRGINTVSFDKSPLYIIDGEVFTGNIDDISATLFESADILKDQSAIAIYGNRGANGVVILKTKSSNLTGNRNKGAEFNEDFYSEVNASNSIRSMFSDYAFWQPKLTTNSLGKVSFKVIFPDDVTKWDTHFLAMDNHKHSGSATHSIKSYKPIMGQLFAPRFMLENDTAFVIGKALNYTSDSASIKTVFEFNGQKNIVHARYFKNSIVDTFKVSALDSINIKYTVEKDKGYLDGESKNIPILPIGIEETKGRFYVLQNDTTINISLDKESGDVTLHANADMLEVIENEASMLINYKYSCNEQLASKLKAMLVERKIAIHQEKKYNHDNEINKLINLLLKNKIKNGLWGWWPKANENYWISLHVLEALSQATALGYKVDLNKNELGSMFIWELDNSTDISQKLRILKIVNLLKININIPYYISEIEKSKKKNLSDLLDILELRMGLNMPYSLDTLSHYEKTTILGNIYYDDPSKVKNLTTNAVINTLKAYKLWRAVANKQESKLQKMRAWLLENRGKGYWANTYESALVIETILPDLLTKDMVLIPPTLTISGGINREVSSFPLSIKVNPSQQWTIAKKGSTPVYLSMYQTKWNNKPLKTKGDFEINTKFEGNTTFHVSAGKEIVLKANVAVKKDAEYVMINIPIPAGCSYADTQINSPLEVHRENFKNETSIFCEKLPIGNYTFEVKLLPKYNGIYTLNPAKVELMYYPTFYANEKIHKVTIN
jgi:alpha-2-macroglobulin